MALPNPSDPGITPDPASFSSVTPDDFYSIDDFSRKHKLWPRQKIEWIVYTRSRNGAERTGAIRKINGRWHIVEPLFVKWCMTGGDQ